MLFQDDLEKLKSLIEKSLRTLEEVEASARRLEDAIEDKNPAVVNDLIDLCEQSLAEVKGASSQIQEIKRNWGSASQEVTVGHETIERSFTTDETADLQCRIAQTDKMYQPMTEEITKGIAFESFYFSEIDKKHSTQLRYSPLDQRRRADGLSFEEINGQETVSIIEVMLSAKPFNKPLKPLNKHKYRQAKHYGNNVAHYLVLRTPVKLKYVFWQQPAVQEIDNLTNIIKEGIEESLEAATKAYEEISRTSTNKSDKGLKKPAKTQKEYEYWKKYFKEFNEANKPLPEIPEKVEFTIDIETWNSTRTPNATAKDDAGTMYKTIREMTDDVDKIADNFEIPKNILNAVKNHVFEEEHYIAVGPEQVKRSQFEPDFKFAQLWIYATKPPNLGEDFSIFKETLQHILANKYVEQGLMKKGLPYRSQHTEAWKEDDSEPTKQDYSPTSEHYGAHDLAPLYYYTPKPDKNPFGHWKETLGLDASKLINTKKLVQYKEVNKLIKEVNETLIAEKLGKFVKDQMSLENPTIVNDIYNQITEQKANSNPAQPSPGN
jgi:arsenate reductase-like glutaredoxin family protein